jgi:uracil-DNA glycosylase family 4
MDARELRRWLEFYRDLGIREIYAGPGFTALAAPPDDIETRKERLESGDAESHARLPAAAAGSGPVKAAAAARSAAGSGAMADSLRSAVSAAAGHLAPPKPAAAQAGLVPLFDAGPEGDSLERIRADIGDCRRCRLCEGRTNIVFGSGAPQAKLVFVGEGPGEDEDLQGLPFVGRAGQLLTQMINNTAAKEGMSVRREHVYICNVVKCRPPKNRTPEPDEMEICGQFLYRQLSVLRPRAICALGATAAKALLGAKEGITKLRGRWHWWREIPVMPTYHPSYLLRPYNQNAKREAWEDLKKVLHYVYDEPPRPLSDL